MTTRVLTIASIALLALTGCNKNKNTDAMADDSSYDDTVYMVYTYPSDTTTTLGSIKADADSWEGRSIRGEVSVTSTPTDRGFWVEGPSGDKMFALIVDEPYDAYKDIDPGQTLELERAMVYTPDSIATVPGAELSAKSKVIARSQSAFLVVDEEDLRILASNETGTRYNR